MRLSFLINSMLGAGLVLSCSPQTSAQTLWHHANDPADQNLSQNNAIPRNGQSPRLGGGSFRNQCTIDPQQALSEEECNDAILQGDIFLKAGKTEAALHSFELAIDYLPNDPLALQKIAETYAATGRVAESAKTYHRLFHDAKWQSVGANPTVYLGYAVILAKTGNPAEAMKFYQEGVRRVNHMDGKQNVKVLLPELVEERLLPEQVRYTPERLQALADTAIAHEELGFGSNKEAIAHMSEAVKLFPESPVTHFYLGEALSRKDPRAAQAAFQKAAELGDEGIRTVVNERLDIAK
jgi:tetratricopeptide (TPR) repeat protein